MGGGGYGFYLRSSGLKEDWDIKHWQGGRVNPGERLSDPRGTVAVIRSPEPGFVQFLAF